jgi:hypothetical protein
LGETVAWTSWEALAPVVGTVISLLFWWHAVSLAAELLLLLATSLGWLWNRGRANASIGDTGRGREAN